jgi:hypothetical protein
MLQIPLLYAQEIITLLMPWVLQINPRKAVLGNIDRDSDTVTSQQVLLNSSKA